MSLNSWKLTVLSAASFIVNLTYKQTEGQLKGGVNFGQNDFLCTRYAPFVVHKEHGDIFCMNCLKDFVCDHIFYGDNIQLWVG